MNHNIFNSLTFTDFYHSILIGACLSILYFFLVWQTVILISRTRNKKRVKFFSSLLRIFLFIFISLAFAQEHAGRFLLIVCGFFLTRFFLFGLLKPSFKKKMKSSEILCKDEKKLKKKTKKRRRSYR